MTSTDTAVALSAVHTYFSGERRELLAMMAGAVLFVSAAALLVFMARDGFSRGLFVTLLVFGLVVGGGAVSLLMRDVGLQGRLTSDLAVGVTQPAGRQALDAERARVAVVLSKFPVYRMAALLLAALALVGMVLSPGGWIHGAAAALLLVGASQSIVDHYSEGRATVYLQRLIAMPMA